jgi:tetratricopeptide (TPR) repeat protein
VHAGNYASFSQDYRKIAKFAQLQENPNETEHEFLIRVTRWLEGPTSGPWILIVDNADNLLEFFPSQVPDADGKKSIGLTRYLPQGTKGSVLITTRDRVVASRLANQDMLEVKAMSPLEAEALLLRYAPDATPTTLEKDALSRLLEEVKFLPLAIVGAAAIMRENDVSVSEYLKIFTENKQARAELMGSEFYDFRRGAEVPEAVLTTYFTLFEKLQQQSPLAADFLRLIAFFDRNGIPKELLLESKLEGTESSVKFTVAVGKLLSFGLMTKSADGTMYHVHQLAHMSIEAFFPDTENKWRSKALQALVRKFQVFSERKAVGNPGCNWDLGAIYTPHAVAVLEACTVAPGPAVATLAFRLGGYLSLIGRFDDAEKHLRHGLEVSKSYGVEGSQSPSAFEAGLILGQLLEMRERFQEAMQWYSEMAETYENAPEGRAMEIVDRLMRIYGKHGIFQLDQAEKIARRSLECKQEALGPAHPDTIPDHLKLAKLLRLQRRYDEALALCEAAIGASQAALGHAAPLTLLSLIKSIGVLQLQEKHEQARNVFEKAFGVYENIKTDDVFALRCFVKLARTAYQQRRSDQAEVILQRAFSIAKVFQKNEDIVVLVQLLLSKIAKLFSLIGNHSLAEQVYNVVLAQNEKSLGPEHPYTLDALYELGGILRDEEKYSEAEAVYLRALKGFEKEYGPDHQCSIKCTMWLGILHAFMGKHDEAKEECAKATDAYKRVYGAEHPRYLRMGIIMEFCLMEIKTPRTTWSSSCDIVNAAQCFAAVLHPRPDMPPPVLPPVADGTRAATLQPVDHGLDASMIEPVD